MDPTINTLLTISNIIVLLIVIAVSLYLATDRSDNNITLIIGILALITSCFCLGSGVHDQQMYAGKLPIDRLLQYYTADVESYIKEPAGFNGKLLDSKLRDESKILGSNQQEYTTLVISDTDSIDLQQGYYSNIKLSITYKLSSPLNRLLLKRNKLQATKELSNVYIKVQKAEIIPND